MKKNIFNSAIILLIALFFSTCNLNYDYPPEHSFSLGPINIVDYPSSSTHYIKDWLPDGKLVPVKKGSNWQLFWAEKVDILTEALTPWPEDHAGQLTIANEVYGKKNENKVVDIITDFNENGSWFIGVYPLNNSGKYVGFYHAESHRDNKGTAHKSIGVTYSDDYGKTWHDSAPIIVDTLTKSESTGWSGLGDGCVIYDKDNKRWLCYYQGKVSGAQNSICLAMSDDPEAKSGTWKKWNGGSFSVEAYNPKTKKGGANHALSNLRLRPGANPSVMWNTYLNKWVMVYHGWDPKKVYIAFSKDGINWGNPSTVIGGADNPIWYPNLISTEGDLVGGKEVRLYFSYQQNPSNGKRKLAYCTLTFN